MFVPAFCSKTPFRYSRSLPKGQTLADVANNLHVRGLVARWQVATAAAGILALSLSDNFLFTGPKRCQHHASKGIQPKGVTLPPAQGSRHQVPASCETMESVLQKSQSGLKLLMLSHWTEDVR